MAPTKYVNRTIPKISLHDFDNRVDEITSQLVHAAETDGFFVLINHGISQAVIDNMFETSESFFNLPDDVKSTIPYSTKNAGWEKNSQIRPSTGAADRKESYQMQYGDNMKGFWPSAEVLPGFKETSLDFMCKAHSVSEKLFLCFARGLGFPDNYFISAHDISHPNIQTVLRLLHYFEVDKTAPVPDNYYRAGAHTDWDFVTLLFQRTGQSGLEICPGRETSTEFGIGDMWTKIDPAPGEIICNIGDLLMSWSDDRFKSTIHRVKTPSEEGDYYGPRYSIAYFNQPAGDFEIQGPKKKYPMITASEFIKAAINRNYKALMAKREALDEMRQNIGDVTAA